MQVEINIPMFWYNPKHPINIPYHSRTIKLYIQEPLLNNPDIINNAMKIIKKSKSKSKNEKSKKIRGLGDIFYVFNYPDYNKIILRAEKKEISEN